MSHGHHDEEIYPHYHSVLSRHRTHRSMSNLEKEKPRKGKIIKEGIATMPTILDEETKEEVTRYKILIILNFTQFLKNLDYLFLNLEKKLHQMCQNTSLNLPRYLQHFSEGFCFLFSCLLEFSLYFPLYKRHLLTLNEMSNLAEAFLFLFMSDKNHSISD